MTPAFDRLLDLARTEVQTAIDTLPDELRHAAETVVGHPRAHPQRRLCR